MIRWIFLVLAILSVVAIWGVGSEYLPIVVTLVMFANFATFCILYEQPMERARKRRKDRMSNLQPNSDEAHRLETAPIRPNAADRQLGHGPMVMANYATGVACTAFLVLGLVLRIT